MPTFPLGFGYYLDPGRFFRPKSLQAALQALRQGNLPPEGLAAYVTGTRPILEEPFDLAAFDRVLSRPDLDLRSALPLMTVFERMTASRDTDQALFGAESMNAVEARFGKAAQDAFLAFQTAAEADRAPLLRRFLRAQFRLALLNRRRPAILRYYCLECLRHLRQARGWYRLRLSDVMLLVAVHRELGRPDRAVRILDAARRRGWAHLRLDLARADLAFRAGNAAEALGVLDAVPAERRTPKLEALAAFWRRTGPGTVRG